MRTWTTQSITLNCTVGPVQREARVCQGLAVHRYGRGWTVTHVESGRAIVPTGLSRRNAFRWARALLSLGDWTGPVEAIMCYKSRVADLRASCRAPGAGSPDEAGEHGEATTMRMGEPAKKRQRRRKRLASKKKR